MSASKNPTHARRPAAAIEEPIMTNDDFAFPDETLVVHVYSTGPIDHWDGWLRGSAALATLEVGGSVSHFFAAAQHAAGEIGWEGDMREGPFVSALPNPGRADSQPLIAWKQNNNGTTFIASPVRLDYLDEGARATARLLGPRGHPEGDLFQIDVRGGLKRWEIGAGYA